MINNTLDTNKKSKVKSEKKIIKRSWKKITIILSLLFILVVGLSVGLYFLFRPNKFNLNSKILNDNKISIEKAKNKILENKTDKNIGLFFYKEKGDATNYMTYGDAAGSKGDYSDVEGIGPFSYWVDKEDESNTTWYSIDIDSTHNLEEDLFLIENGKGGYELNNRMIDGDWSEGFLSQSNVTEGSGSWSDATKLQLDVTEGSDDSKEDYKGWKVVTRNDTPPEPDPPAPELSFTYNPSNEETEFNISEGSTMIFNKDGKIKGLVNGYDSSTPIDHDNEEDYRSWYKTFFNDFVDLNNYDD